MDELMSNAHEAIESCLFEGTMGVCGCQALT